MKQLTCLLLALVMAFSLTTAWAGVQEEAEAAKTLSHEELLEKAKAETGNFVVYGNTSRITTALESFCEKYGFQGVGNNLKDAEIYTKLEIEIDSNAEGADMVMIQDGASLKQMMENNYLVSFLPASVAEHVHAEDQMPLVQQFVNKLFIYNSKGDQVPAIRNVWELTEEKMKGQIIFKNPEAEQVGMNFLVMVTKDEWAKKLADAYEAYFGKPIELGNHPNAGYLWIAEFLANCTFGSSDTSIAEEISQETAEGKIGLFVLSKLRSSSVLNENLIVGQYDATEKGYAIEPFSGFMYPMYALLSAGATRPYTAMLFIEYLMTEEGFQPWGKNIGAYSPNTEVPIKEGDLPLSVWKETLVIEDPEWILNQYEAVSTFVTKFVQ